jgi:hypothetical protein
MARNQLFHLPDSEGRFGTCDVKQVCTETTHGTACAQKCHQDHQQIAVKGHGGKTAILVDDHGAHTIIEDDLTPYNFDAVAHVKSLPDVAGCTDCAFEEWTPAAWNKENARLAREGKSLADRKRSDTPSRV